MQIRAAWLLPLVSLAFLAAGGASALEVSLNVSATSALRTEAWDPAGPASALDDVFPENLPYASTSTSPAAEAFAESDYVLSNSGFDITFDHIRPSANGGHAYSEGDIQFAVDEDVPFAAAGTYAASDPSAHRIRLEVSLFDLTLGEFVFISSQESVSTPNESFTLGGLGGDASNQATGSLTGTLLVGHEYGLYYRAAFETVGSAAASAPAAGAVTLSFIPEPGTGLLLTAGLCILGITRPRAQRGDR